jgi:hypothetical protein
MMGHWSDCAVYNEPAYPNGPCDCGVDETPELKTTEDASEDTSDDDAGRPR